MPSDNEMPGDTAQELAQNIMDYLGAEPSGQDMLGIAHDIQKRLDAAVAAERIAVLDEVWEAARGLVASADKVSRFRIALNDIRRRAEGRDNNG